MRPWFEDLLTEFDLESTGINVRTARIVTGYAATSLGDMAPDWCRVSGAQVLINPGVPIPKGASDVHGITDEVARAKGCDPVDGVNSIAEALARSLNGRIPVAGFNLAYDFGLLYHECLRHGLPTLAERVGRTRDAMFGPIIDAHVLDKHVSHRRGSRKLDDSKGPGTATFWGVPLLDAHRADADAIAAGQVARVIGRRHPEIGAMSTVDLHIAQKGWRAEQMTSLQRYFRTMKGQSDAWCDPCWPACVNPDHPSG